MDQRVGDYYRRSLSLTSIAGLCRLPQVSMPLGHTEASPVGLSLIGAQGEDRLLLDVAVRISKNIRPTA